jgi:vacuolar protein sorting-associated protein 54
MYFSICRHLGSQLCELEKLIDKMMIAEFSTYSHSDLNRPLEDDCQVLEEVCFKL